MIELSNIVDLLIDFFTLLTNNFIENPYIGICILIVFFLIIKYGIFEFKMDEAREQFQKEINRKKERGFKGRIASPKMVSICAINLLRSSRLSLGCRKRARWRGPSCFPMPWLRTYGWLGLEPCKIDFIN